MSGLPIDHAILDPVLWTVAIDHYPVAPCRTGDRVRSPDWPAPMSYSREATPLQLPMGLASLGAPANKVRTVHLKDFQRDDPKAVFEAAFGITDLNHQEPRISQLTFDAPLHTWLLNESFENFYDELRQKSIEMGCQIQNLRDRHQ